MTTLKLLTTEDVTEAPEAPTYADEYIVLRQDEALATVAALAAYRASLKEEKP